MMAAGRREDRRRPAPRASCRSRRAQPATTARGAGGGSDRQWDVRIQYAAATSTHTLHLRQKGNDLDGSHQGDFVTRDLTGTIDGDTRADPQRLRRAARRLAQLHVHRQGHRRRRWRGTLDMGEYLGATWTATRRDARRRTVAQSIGRQSLACVGRRSLVGACRARRRRSAAPQAPAPPPPRAPSTTCCCAAATSSTREQDQRRARRRDRRRQDRARSRRRSIPPRRCKTVDVSGLYVTPGLIDIHAHVYTGTGERSSYAGDNSVYPDGFTLPRRRHHGGRRRRLRLAQLRGLQAARHRSLARPASSPSSTSSATACAAGSSSRISRTWTRSRPPRWR